MILHLLALATGVAFFLLFLPLVRSAGTRATRSGVMGHAEANRIARRLGPAWSPLDVMDLDAHGRLDEALALLDTKP